MEYFVYILECCDGSYYTGVAKDVAKRLKVHQSGKGSRCVAAKLPFRLVYTEQQPSKSAALKREIVIKSMTRKQKLALVANKIGMG